MREIVVCVVWLVSMASAFHGFKCCRWVTWWVRSAARRRRGPPRWRWAAALARAPPATAKSCGDRQSCPVTDKQGRGQQSNQWDYNWFFFLVSHKFWHITTTRHFASHKHKGRARLTNFRGKPVLSMDLIFGQHIEWRLCFTWIPDL